jgi:aflatoxin B1 aldehyde reductase
LRWDKSTPLGQLYRRLYERPKLISALKQWEEISNESGISKAALSYQWVTYNSSLTPEIGDNVIVWSSSPEQLRSSLKYLEDGPLEKEVTDRIDAVWNSVRDEAVLDNFNLELK